MKIDSFDDGFESVFFSWSLHLVFKRTRQYKIKSAVIGPEYSIQKFLIRLIKKKSACDLSDCNLLEVFVIFVSDYTIKATNIKSTSGLLNLSRL